MAAKSKGRKHIYRGGAEKKVKKGFKKMHGKNPLESSVNLEKLAEMTDGMTGVDIAAVVNTEAMAGIKEQIAAGGRCELDNQCSF